MRRAVQLSLALVVAASGLVGCGSPAPAVVESPGHPVISPADPYTWFDKPLGGFRIAQEPYEVILHASAIEGIAMVELKISGEAVRSFPNPAPGETLATVRHVWTPAHPGRYLLRARTQDVTGTWSAYADVSVEVLAAATPTVTPSPTPTATPTVTPTPTSVGALTEASFWPDVISLRADCGEQAVTAVIGASDPASVQVIVAFYRVLDSASGQVTAWEGAAMNPQGNGRYVLAIQPSRPGSATRSAVAPWVERQGRAFSGQVQVQFALQTLSGAIVRSPIYYNAATLKLCAP